MGVEVEVDQVLNSVNEPAITPQPQQPIQVNELVTIDNPGSKYHDKQATVVRLKTEKHYGQELQKADVSVPGEKRCVEVQVSWLQRVGEGQANE